ncbi:hypothetical protein BGX27_000740 [Mortierella sp. AM989]|nr:hypothetical protein BGX27_000740 [Mortierella sp. AM989]
MLLLVPSHKADDSGAGKNSTAHSRVLVLLPSDIDLSSNVVVPDTAITTTLGTNDTLEMSNLSASPYSIQKTTIMNLTKYSRDHLGIMQPSESVDFAQLHPQLHPQHSQQPNIQLPPERSVDINSTPYYYHTDRARRHSHTGLVNGGVSTIAYSRSRTKSRQSFSQASPYQFQRIRTPRALRAALRKARKDQSPLLTSTSFGSDYTTSNLINDLDSDDRAPPMGAVVSMSPVLSSNSSPSRTASLSMGFDCPLSVSSRTRDESASSQVIFQKTHAKGSAEVAHHDGHGYRAESEIKEPESDIKLDKSEDVDTWRDSASTISITSSGSSRRPFKRHNRELSEILDVDGLSDDDICVEPKFFNNATPQFGEELPRESEEDHQDIELNNALDADMAMILGMASDMELVMPKFDDEYLDDLKNDRLLVGQSRRSPTVSTVSPSYSHYSSTTITCLSSQPSPKLHPGTPSAIADGSKCRAESLPVSPGVLAARARMQSPNASQMDCGPPQSPHSSTHSPAQNLSIIHQDIDHLKRHRNSLMQNPDMATKPLPKSPSLPSTSERKSQGPIYFNPSHHGLPVHSGPGEHQRQNIMVIQSSQWIFENKGSAGAKALQPVSQQGRHHLQGNGGNQIFRIQEPLHPVSPQPALNKGTVMTANNISLVTANMSVLTPQEVQEDYYARRNLRIHQQRQRRKSAVLDQSSSVGPPLQGAGSNPWIRRFSSSNVHPFEKPVVPAIGATPLPASYYIPPSAFRTEAAAAAEKEAERKWRGEQEEESFLVFPSPTLS